MNYTSQLYPVNRVTANWISEQRVTAKTSSINRGQAVIMGYPSIGGVWHCSEIMPEIQRSHHASRRRHDHAHATFILSRPGGGELPYNRDGVAGRIFRKTSSYGCGFELLLPLTLKARRSTETKHIPLVLRFISLQLGRFCCRHFLGLLVNTNCHKSLL